MFPRLLACASVLLATFAADASAAKPKPARPVGKNVEVQVQRGGSVRIPLRGFERNLNPLVYRPLEKPRHGSLSGLEQYEGSERQGPGFITYTHNDDESSVADTFSFEVKAPMTGLAGRGRVTVTIVDAPPQPVFSPAVVDFGKVAIGDPAVRHMLDLANVGGGALRGAVEPAAPFAVEGEGRFLLRRGGSTRIPLLFAPERTGFHSYPMQPVPGDPTVVTLRGEAIAPIAVEATGATFSAGHDKSRIAIAVVKNMSVRPRKISVVLPAGSPVAPVPVFDLAQGGSTNVALHIPPEQKEYLPAFDVRFETEGHSEVREFSAAAIPANLVVVSTPDFGEIKSGSVGRASLVLRNEGGATAEAKLLPHESISAASGAPAFAIPSGQEEEIPLELRLGKDQPQPASLTIQFQGSEVRIDVKANVAKDEALPSPGPSPTPKIPNAEWVLNEDIRYLDRPEGPVIEWSEKSGYQKFNLQHRPDGIGDWRNYEMPVSQEGFFQRLKRKFEEFVTTEIKRPVIEESADASQSSGKASIEQTRLGTDIWRLTAARKDGGIVPVTDPFRVADGKLVAVKDTSGKSQAPAERQATRPEETQSNRTRTIRKIGAVTEIDLSATGIKSEKRSALIQVAFSRVAGLRGFRLERGSMVSPIDPKTGLPQESVFERIDPPQAQVEILGMAEAETEGRKLSICAARISELEPGSRTFWRVVPEGPDGDLPPTAVLFVDTLPRAPFPWNTVLFVTLVLLIAGVLYLRWKMRRAPAQ